MKLAFPADAVREPMPLSVEVTSHGEPSPDTNVFFASPFYKLEANGQFFSRDVQVTLPYDPSRLPAGVDESKLQPMWWTGRAYLPLSKFRIDRERHEVVYQTRHFSDHVIGGEGRPRIRPPQWEQRYPQLPYDVVIVDNLVPQLQEGFVGALDEAMAFSFRALTEGHPYRHIRPTLDPDERISVEIVDIQSGETAMANGRLRILVDFQMDHAAEMQEVILHEFFHCIQVAYFERGLDETNPEAEIGDGNRFVWFDEAAAAWITEQVLPKSRTAANWSRADLCFEELCYHPELGKQLEGQVRRRGELHHYAGAIFIQYLVSQYGEDFVTRAFDEAFRGADPPRTAEQLLDRQIRRAAQASKRLDDDLYSVYTRFVLDHMYQKQSFGNWDTSRWKLGPPQKLNLPPTWDSRVVTKRLARDQAFSNKFSANSCQVRNAYRLSRPFNDTGSAQLEASLTPGGQAHRSPSTWLYAFVELPGGGHRYALGHATRLNVALAEGENHVVLVPVSLDSQEITFSARLTGPGGPGVVAAAREKWPLEGEWVGKAQVHDPPGRPPFETDYSLRVFSSEDDWFIHLRGGSYYSPREEGCIVQSSPQQIKAHWKLIASEYEKQVRYRSSRLEATVSGDQLVGSEVHMLDDEVLWRKEFTLIRQP